MPAKKKTKTAGRVAKKAVTKKVTKKTKKTKAVGMSIAGSGSVEEEVRDVMASMERVGEEHIRDNMGARYGIDGPTAETAFGVEMAVLLVYARAIKKRHGGKGGAERNHAIAAALWETGQYEARMLATLIDEASLVTPAQMDRWAEDFDNWGICDTACFKLFDQVPPEMVFKKIGQWCVRKEEFVKRAGFALLACVALHDQVTEDEPFVKCLALIERGAADDRNFVKKGVNWALRAIGRRSAALREAAMAVAVGLAESKEASCRWVGKDAMRELMKGKGR